MTTRELVEGLPNSIRFVIEGYRKNYKNPALKKECVRSELAGYLKGLRDAGAITERERQILFVYGTV